MPPKSKKSKLIDDEAIEATAKSKKQTKVKGSQEQKEKDKAKETKRELAFLQSGELSAKIELNLIAAYIGTAKLKEQHVNPNWDGSKLSQNRPLDNGAVNKLSEEFATRGLKRELREHHMHGAVPSDKVDVLVKALGFGSVSEFKERSDKGDYVLVNATKWAAWTKADPKGKIGLQAGQHRFAALKTYDGVKAEDKWWPVRIYNYDTLLPATLTHLRANTNITHTSLGDGSRFLTCYDKQKVIEQLVEIAPHKRQPDHEANNDALWDSMNFEVSLYTEAAAKRHRQIWRHEALRNSIAELMIAVPALRTGLKLSVMNDILAFRSLQVNHE
jgi:hypothetical protein